MTKEPYSSNIAPMLPGYEEELADTAAGGADYRAYEEMRGGFPLRTVSSAHRQTAKDRIPADG